MKTIYRIQDKDGRGPWKPGFSAEWVREDPDYSLVPWIHTLGPIHLKASQEEFVGCGCRNKDQLRKWITQEEYEKLLKFGYQAVKLKARILGEDHNQAVFAKDSPINTKFKVFKLY